MSFVSSVGSTSSALLIGFGYEGCVTPHGPRLEELPGTRIDLYQAWKYCHRIGIRRIFVLTDLDADIPTAGLLKMVIDDVVDANLTTFVADIKSNREYRRFEPHQFRQQLVNLVNKLMGTEKLLVYYTGHGISGSLQLPDATTFAVPEFRDILLKSCAVTTQILWIMDCCYASNLELPYKLDLSQNKYRLVNLNYSPLPELVCFVSSHLVHSTSSTNKGSPFSRSLFRYMNEGVRSVHRLKGLIDQTLTKLVSKSNSSKRAEQFMEIYSSYPHLRFLWSWVYGGTVEIELDWSNSIIRISPSHLRSPSLEGPLRVLPGRSSSPDNDSMTVREETRDLRKTSIKI